MKIVFDRMSIVHPKVRTQGMRRASRFSGLITLLVTGTLLTSIGCSRQESSPEDLAAPQTGSLLTEDQDVSSQVVTNQGAVPVTPKPGQIGYVTADSVRVRTSPETGEANIAGRLNINDQIEIVDATEVGPDAFLKIRVLTSSSAVGKSDSVFIAKRFLSQTKLKIDPVATSGLIESSVAPKATGQASVKTQRLFIVTNIATEKLRVYQRCLPSEGCVNRMIAEMDVVNGGTKNENRTNVGYYQVSSWTKFYETGPYPAWYKPGYPAVPKPGNRSDWFSQEYMPGGKGAMRGAFGWYTAKVHPNAGGQWTHGTGGWGADKKDFIVFKDTFWGALASIFKDLRSHGCTRVDNESIAYIRQLIAVGTPLIKIYAREGLRDSSRLSYSKVPANWEYIMTRNGHQGINSHQLADRATVLRQGTPQSEWIEQGTYQIDQYPNSDSGDIYGIGGFEGTFIVDEGTLSNYRHPAKIGRGGMSDTIAPPYMITNNPHVQEDRSAPTSYQGGGPRRDRGPPFGGGHNENEFNGSGS